MVIYTCRKGTGQTKAEGLPGVGGGLPVVASHRPTDGVNAQESSFQIPATLPSIMRLNTETHHVLQQRLV